MSGQHTRRRDSKSYQVVYETMFGKYSLNGVDANLDPGPKRPFNFFGQFSEVRHVFNWGGGGGRPGNIEHFARGLFQYLTDMTACFLF